MTELANNKESEVWAVSSGKGGTGKSFIISSLGTCLASRGNRVVLIDADFGGANLHSFLGLRRPKASLTDFFEKKRPLNELMIDTGIHDLRLVPGDVGSLDSDNIKYTQKLKLFRHIRSIDTDYVLIDLSAGSTYKTIDTFLLADKMLAIMFPQVIAIENIYHFVKNVVFRKLVTSFRAHGIRDIVQFTWKNREEYGIRNLRELIDFLKGMSNIIADIIASEFSDFRIHLVLNHVRTRNEAVIGSYVQSIFKRYFGFNMHYLGYVAHDDSIWRSVNERKTFMKAYPLSKSAREIEGLADNLMNGDQVILSRG
jgi:flagellar biosynthesis protein FlhG